MTEDRINAVSSSSKSRKSSKSSKSNKSCVKFVSPVASQLDLQLFFIECISPLFLPAEKSLKSLLSQVEKEREKKERRGRGNPHLANTRESNPTRREGNQLHLLRPASHQSTISSIFSLSLRHKREEYNKLKKKERKRKKKEKEERKKSEALNKRNNNNHLNPHPTFFTSFSLIFSHLFSPHLLVENRSLIQTWLLLTHHHSL